MHNFVHPLPQFGTEAHYLCAKFYYTMSHYTTQFYILQLHSLLLISHFGVSRGFDFLQMPPPPEGPLYIYARVRNDQEIPTKSILAFQEGLFTLGRQLKKNIHI